MQLKRQVFLLNELNQRQIEPTKPIQLTKQIKPVKQSLCSLLYALIAKEHKYQLL